MHGAAAVRADVIAELEAQADPGFSQTSAPAPMFQESNAPSPLLIRV